MDLRYLSKEFSKLVFSFLCIYFLFSGLHEEIDDQETVDAEARKRKISEAADTTADVSISEVKEEAAEKKKKKKKDKSKDETEDQNGNEGSAEVSF